MRPLHICNGTVAVLAPGNVTDFTSTSATSFEGEWLPGYLSTASYNSSAGSQPTWDRRLSQSAWGYVAVYCIVFVLATVGNSFVIATLAMNKRMGTVTNYFLLSLAVSDLMVALVCIPITLIGRIKQEFIFGPVMCKIMAYLMGVSVSVSTFTMVAISLERYYAICRPLQARGWQTKSHACKVILGIWVFSFLLMVPIAVYQTIKLQPIAKWKVCTAACRINFPDQESGSGHLPSTPASHKVWYVFQLIVLLCIPGLMMTIAYGCVCKTIYNGFRFVATKQDESRGVEMRKNASPRQGRIYKPASLQPKSSSEGKSEDSKAGVSNQPLVGESAPTKSNGLKSILKRNGKMKTTAYETSYEESRRSETRKQLEAKKKVVEMLIVIVVLFFTCWTPTFVANAWKSFEPLRAMKSLEKGIVIIQILQYVSSCVNPVVYCFLNKRFRKAFLNIFCICCGCLPKKCRPNSRDNQSTFRENRDVAS